MSCVFMLCFFCLMIRLPPRSTRPDALVLYPTLFRSLAGGLGGGLRGFADRLLRVGERALRGFAGLTRGLCRCFLRGVERALRGAGQGQDRKSTRLNSSH